MRNGARGERGFTLIELLVVISIIALLSSVVLSALNSARQKAQISKAKQELVQIAKAIVIAQGETGNNLLTITGSGCSECPCRDIGSLINISSGHACYINWVSLLNAVQAGTGGIVKGLTSMTRDPWGSPYLVDENEGEGGPADCRNDFLASAGPNGIRGDSDDIPFTVPLRKNPCP